ncbi:cyanophycin synthetase [Deinococcus sonorensis]|uniref:Cyanophycin synthetase n=2 Tax=Deinococcus sonorensis TaxID=309891 RepID=A0AAU7UEL3_9DEIO
MTTDIRPMQVLERGVYRGPHLYSTRPMIRVMLDLGTLEAWPTHLLPTFTDRLLALLPGLESHHCSLQRPGGFVERLRDGTWLGHVTEHVALELQRLTGATVTRGKTRSVRGRPGVYQVLYAYDDEAVGLLAGRLALQLVDSLLPDDLRGVQGLDLIEDAPPAVPAAGAPLELGDLLSPLQRLARRRALGPTTASLVKEARRRGIPVARLDDVKMVLLGTGQYQQRIQASITGRTSHIAVQAASNKVVTKTLLAEAEVPVPRGQLVRSADEAVQVARRLRTPVVTKPFNGHHGEGVSVELSTEDQVREGYRRAAQYAPQVVVEQYYRGNDHRILVVNGQVVAVAERVPAQVTGDGHQTIGQLIEEVNRDPRRGSGHGQVLTRIEVDDALLALLPKQGLTLESVPASGQTVVLRETANLSTGGIAIDRTDVIHPDNAWLAVRAARATGLDIAGIDMISPDISRPVTETGGGVVEVNAAPGFRMHLAPSEGQPRDVARPVMAMLFPRGTPSRVPILAVTGTNGKSTTSRMIAHVFRSLGRTVGLTTTSGVYVNSQLVTAGDATGPRSARLVLRDPSVEVAVLETARGGLLREGLGFDHCDVGVVLNVQADHLGLKGIDTLQDLARVKGVIARSVHRRGTSVLNADDPLTARMARYAGGRPAFFSIQAPLSAPLRRHIEGGGLATVREVQEGQDWIVLYRGGERQPLLPTGDVPATLGGLAEFNVQNALAATAACVAAGVEPGQVAEALRSFSTSFEQSPGRLNVYDGHPFRVVLDYAHNEAGLQALGQLLQRMRPPQGRLLGMVSIPGDRRDEDIYQLGRTAAGIFDELVFREAPDGRGRPTGDVLEKLTEGALAAGFAQDRIHRVLRESDAADTALRLAQPGDLVVLLPTDITGVWRQVQQFNSSGA